MTTNEFSVKDSFHFAEEIVDQQPDLFNGGLNVDSLFFNITLEKTTDICTNKLFKQSESIESTSKSELKELSSLVTEDLHFTFE